jgi:hypothetical protein
MSSRFFWLTLMLMVTTIAIKFIDNQLISDKTPAGIISFQLAANFNLISQIVQTWNDTQLKIAIFQFGFDYLYLVVYCGFLYLLCQRLQKARSISTRAFIEKTPYLCGLIAIADCIENGFAIKLLLSEHLTADISQLSEQVLFHLNLLSAIIYWATVIKFWLLAGVFIYIVYALLQYRKSFQKR